MALEPLAETMASSTAREELPAGGRSARAWRTLLESRWGERLISVITLSLAYHDTADQPRGQGAASQRHAREVRRLMREAIAARRALCDTEDALARLSAGDFGRCEQCAGPIPADNLAQAPETRYCPRCHRAGVLALGIRRVPRAGREDG